ncbi:uncharacterized protein [Fopius arisanus]|uniref:Uncharacterized protein isoform X2 n=1 Tax=Fopius arisanus TaxID=64838 RepID=A0A9R1U4E2_9HYME|nr:PREDICTED: uncharacterized protein LOC105269782 isoform X2 [Fopius arisanus]
MGNKSHRGNDGHTVMKQIWSGIEKNPQYHANLFFIGYFTTDPDIPLSIDARTSAKFRLIMEALGYLLLDTYNKPNQLEYITGYIAMIHKDMELISADMFNFGASLVHYLTITFPQSMSPNCQSIVSGYIHNILDGISRKLEDFRETDIRTNITGNSDDIPLKWKICLKSRGRLRWRSKSASIYGHTVDYWMERKRKWDERLESWRCHDHGTTTKIEVSPSEDIPRVKIGEATVEDIGSHADQFLKSYGVIEEIKRTSCESRRRRPTLMTKKSGEMQYKVVETMINAVKSDRERDSIITNSTARQRRRERQLGSP